MAKTKTKKTPKPKVKSFTVDRSTWINGEMKKIYTDAGLDEPDSQLLNGEGQMCCLGFYAKSCGIPRTILDGMATPDDIEIGAKSALNRLSAIVEPSGFRFKNTDLGHDLMQANDKNAKSITPKQRERRIATLFAKAGIKVKFVGEYPKASDL